MKAFNSAKDSSIGLRSGEYGGKYIITHLLDPPCVMEGRIIHNKNRLRLWPFTTQRKELLDEILKDRAVGGSLEDAC